MILCNLISIQRPVLNRFRKMDGLDLFLAFEVGDGPGHFENSCVGPGAQAEPINGQFE